MIYEILSKEIESYIEHNEEKFKNINCIVPDFKTLSPTELVIYVQQLTEDIGKLGLIDINACSPNIMSQIRNNFYPKIKDYENSIDEINKEKDNKIQEVYDVKGINIRNMELKLQKAKNKKMNSLQSIIKSHEKLLTLKPELERIMQIHSIPFIEEEMDISNLDLEAIEELEASMSDAIDEALSFKNINSKILELLYLPIVKDLDVQWKAIHFSILIIWGILLKPYFMGIVGFVYIISFLSKLKGVHERKELIQKAQAYLNPIDLDRFITTDDDVLKCEAELEEAKVQDLSKEIKEIEDLYAKKLIENEALNPELEIMEFQAQFNLDIENITSKLKGAQSKLKLELTNLKMRYADEISKVRAYISKLKKSTTYLGDYIAESTVFSNKYKTGGIYLEGSLLFESITELPTTNIQFCYSNEQEYAKQIEYLKLMLCNAICNVKEKQLKIILYDFENIGREFAEFYREDTKDLFEIRNDRFNELLEGLINKGKKRLEELRGKNINEYNSEAEKVNKVSKQYTLLVILSTDDKLSENKAFLAFMKYSASLGYLIWNIAEQLPNTDDILLVERPGKFEGYEPIKEPAVPYTYSMDLCTRTLNSYAEAVETRSLPILDYKTEFLEKIVPEDKIWSYSTIGGVELNFGYVDGDPSRPDVEMLSDQPPHALMVGASGAGKSVAINQMIMTLCHKYSPNELELIMIDFKNIEFAVYAKEYTLPHARIISGTKDGEYAISIFEYLIQVMEDRTKLFNEAGVKNLKEYNNICDPSKRLPRLLLICDEFQVMFTEVDQKSVMKITTLIKSAAKLARFAGLHMWFTSQSMKDTLSKDVLDQFGLRVALRCSSDVSQQLIGSSISSQLPKLGFLYTNDTGGEVPDASTLYKIPYLNTEDLNNYLKELKERCAKEGCIDHNAKFYDEGELHQGTEIEECYNRIPKLENEKGFLLLGERTSFSLNKVPTHIKFMKDDEEHAFVIAFEKSDTYNLANTFIENCRVRNVKCMVHSADGDAIKAMGLNSKVDEEFKPLLNHRLDVEILLETLEDLIDQLEVDPELIEERYFIAMYWEKLQGIGRNSSFKLETRLTQILQRACLVDLHIIFICKGLGDLNSISKLCSHKIVGFCGENISLRLLENSRAAKLPPENFAIYKYGQEENKFKVYQFPTIVEIGKREVYIEE